MCENEGASDQTPYHSAPREGENNSLREELSTLNAKIQAVTDAYKAANAAQNTQNRVVNRVNWHTFLAVVGYSTLTAGILLINTCQLRESQRAADAAAEAAREIGKQTPELIKTADAARKAADAAKSAADTAARQLAEMKLQTPALIDAAKASQSSADTTLKSLIDVQRPVLAPTLTDVMVPQQVENLNTKDFADRQISVAIHFTNVGQQIAFFDRVVARLWIQTSEEATKNPGILDAPSYRTDRDFGICVKEDARAVLSPNKSITYPCNVSITGNAYQNLMIGRARVWLQVFIRYSDALGVTRDAGVTWHYVGPTYASDGGFLRDRRQQTDYDKIVETAHDSGRLP